MTIHIAKICSHSQYHGRKVIDVLRGARRSPRGKGWRQRQDCPLLSDSPESGARAAMYAGTFSTACRQSALNQKNHPLVADHKGEEQERKPRNVEQPSLDGWDGEEEDVSVRRRGVEGAVLGLELNKN